MHKLPTCVAPATDELDRQGRRSSDCLHDAYALAFCFEKRPCMQLSELAFDAQLTAVTFSVDPSKDLVASIGCERSDA